MVISTIFSFELFFLEKEVFTLKTNSSFEIFEKTLTGLFYFGLQLFFAPLFYVFKLSKKGMTSTLVQRLSQLRSSLKKHVISVQLISNKI